MNPENETNQKLKLEEEADDISSILPTNSILTDSSPTTDHSSRKAMLRAERQDEIEITEVERQFESRNLPVSYQVVQRNQTYFGPELLLASNQENFLLTAPGPDTQLLLWSERVNDNEFRTNWARTAEVRVEISETNQYDICDQCGYPIRSDEHERLSLLGRCPEGSKI